MCKGKALALITGAIHRVCGVECLFRLRRPGQADSAQLCEKNVPHSLQYE
jgi:hypothetical protein